MKHIPKRPHIPIVTDVLEYREAANNTIAYTQSMIERYGTVCECSFLGVKNYFIHDPDVIKEILTTQGNSMKRTYLFSAFRKFLGNGLFTADGDYHKHQRRLLKPALYPQRIEEYTSVMVECAEHEISTWKDNDSIEVLPAMTRITLNIITRTMFGSGLTDAEITSVGNILSSAFTVLNTIIGNPVYVYCLLHNIKLPIIKTFYDLKKELDVVILNIIATYRRQGSAQKTDLLSLLLDAKDEDTGTGMTDEQIRDEVVTFFVAGHETTTLALTWTLYLLAKHPKQQRIVQNEIREVISGRTPQSSDYPQLVYTKNVLKESLRLYPPAWTFAREPITDVVIKDYHFPKGSVLWTVTYLIHHSSEYFTNPEMFLPERWNDEFTKQLPKYAYFPFGGGNRMCIGEGFAWMEGILTLACIFKQYSVTMPAQFTTTVQPLFTLKPKDSILVTVNSNP